MTRPASAVGAGLSPARSPRTIRPGERIHVLGAAGAGGSAATLLANYAGGDASGCDPGSPSPYTPPIDAAGIRLFPRHDPTHVTGPTPPDRLAVTKALTAVAPDHPELAAGRTAGIPVEPWQQVVADAAVGRTLVAVAGTHGKSTTAGWLTHVLVAAGLDPGAFVGALLDTSVTGGLPATARWGEGSMFVVEADEYAGNFDPYRPSVAVLTTVEWDHPDVFADRAAVIEAFVDWLRTAAEHGSDPRPTIVANVGDPGVVDVLERLAPWPGQIIATGLVDQAPQRLGGFGRAIADEFASETGPGQPLIGRIVGRDPVATDLELYGLDQVAGPLTARLRTAGRHNAANALAVAGAALRLGLDPATIIDGLASFEGVGRRLERKGEVGGVVVYDDYGHHPTAIRETLLAVRQREPDRRVWAVYEPLTYHRTAALLEEFARALAGADAVAIAEIWAGRDPDMTIVSAEALASAVARLRPDIPVGAPGTVEETARWLSREVAAGDVVLVMGGGRSYRIGELLLEALAAR